MKFLTIPLFSLLSFSAMATEITSPFYLPDLGKVLSTTQAQYTKNKQTLSPTLRQYKRQVNQQIMLGLGGGFATLFEGNINWNKQKQDVSFSTPHATDYGVGLQAQGEFEKILMQVSALYRQTTDTAFAPRREIETHLRLGKNLKTMTPYLHLAGNFPLNARAEFNEPLYRAETGVFQGVNKNLTLDSALFLQYDKNIHGRSYGIRSELAYLMTSWSSVALNGAWQARGHAKNNTKTYHQSVGLSFKIAF